MSNPSSQVLAFPAPRPLVLAPASADFRRPVIAGLVTIAIAFGGLGAWSALAPLDSAVVAPGVLAVEGKRKTVQHFEGGIIKEILVRDGDAVTAGQTLVRLDDTQALANLAMVRDRLVANRATEARLVAERDGRDGVAFPADLAVGDPVVDGILAGQRSQFEERGKSLVGQIAILDQRIAQLSAQIDGFHLQQDSKHKQIDLYNQELVGLRELSRKGYYPRTRILAMERDLARLEGEVGTNNADIARAGEGIGEARIQILQLQQRFREDVVAQLRDIQTETNELTERLVAAQDVVRRLTIAAPVAGIVQGLKVFTAGGVIPAGADLMEIVPSHDRLIIEAQVSPADVEAMANGLTAEIRFPALNKRSTPVIDGHVLTVSPDRLTDQRTNQPYYAARVEIPADQQRRLGDHRLQAGMPAEVIVKTGERTMLGYLLKPLSDSFSRSFTER